MPLEIYINMPTLRYQFIFILPFTHYLIEDLSLLLKSLDEVLSNRLYTSKQRNKRDPNT